MNGEIFDEEEQLARIKGSGSKRPDMGLLNQKKVSKWEMDELFADEDEYFEEF